MLSLELGADVRHACSEDPVEERPGHAPVLVLIGTEVMVDMPRRVLPTPVGIEVALAMNRVVGETVAPNPEHEAWRHEGDGRHRDGCYDEAKSLFGLRARLPDGPRVCVIAPEGRSDYAMVLVPVEGPKTRALPSESMKDVLVKKPLGSVADCDTDQKTKHANPSKNSSRFSHSALGYACSFPLET